MSDMRTPLARVKGLGSAKEGLRHWWMQRITAIANIPLVAAAIWIVLLSLRTDYAGVINLVGDPCVGAILILFVANLFYHAALGLQVVIEDYVSGRTAKFLLLIFVKFSAVLIAMIGIVSVIVVIVQRASGS
jgi:succinate dehydrogenase / fumarate reductase, membrane anchor subunit